MLDTDFMSHFINPFLCKEIFFFENQITSILLSYQGQPDAKIRKGKSYLHKARVAYYLLYDLKLFTFVEI